MLRRKRFASIGWALVSRNSKLALTIAPVYFDISHNADQIAAQSQ